MSLWFPRIVYFYDAQFREYPTGYCCCYWHYGNDRWGMSLTLVLFYTPAIAITGDTIPLLPICWFNHVTILTTSAIAH